jgi:predicted nucleotidyltransferase
VTARLVLSDEELRILSDILRVHVPLDISVHVFGSRASGKVKRWSDLDLVLEGATPLPLALLSALSEAFEESDLPWKVDVVDRKAVGTQFGKLIDQAKVEFDRSRASDE